MNEEIMIDGIKYLRADSIKMEIKDGILDVTNVALYFKLKEHHLIGSDIIKVNDPQLTFKRIGQFFNDGLIKFSADMSIYTVQNEKNEIIGTYSIEFLNYWEKVLCGLRCKNKPEKFSGEVYIGWDEEGMNYKKDYPILLKYLDFVVIIAPRVDN